MRVGSKRRKVDLLGFPDEKKNVGKLGFHERGCQNLKKKKRELEQNVYVDEEKSLERPLIFFFSS